MDWNLIGRIGKSSVLVWDWMNPVESMYWDDKSVRREKMEVCETDAEQYERRTQDATKTWK